MGGCFSLWGLQLSLSRSGPLNKHSFNTPRTGGMRVRASTDPFEEHASTKERVEASLTTEDARPLSSKKAFSILLLRRVLFKRVGQTRSRSTLLFWMEHASISQRGTTSFENISLNLPVGSPKRVVELVRWRSVVSPLLILGACNFIHFPTGLPTGCSSPTTIVLRHVSRDDHESKLFAVFLCWSTLRETSASCSRAPVPYEY